MISWHGRECFRNKNKEKYSNSLLSTFVIPFWQIKYTQTVVIEMKKLLFCFIWCLSFAVVLSSIVGTMLPIGWKYKGSKKKSDGSTKQGRNPRQQQQQKRHQQRRRRQQQQQQQQPQQQQQQQ